MTVSLMSEAKPAPKPSSETVADEKVVHGVVAEFSDVDSLLAACERVRDAGYTKADAFTPFPVHGIDKALGIKPTVLPWIALAAGFSGTCIALLMQIGMNGDWFEGFSYPYIISGKPFVSLPAFIPVSFELTILLASFGTFFGMWALNGLPRFSNPMFTSPRFDRATDDTFFLFLDAKDARFNEAGAKTLLADLGGEFIEPVLDDESSKRIPKFLITSIAVVIAFSLIPALLVARMRVTKSSSPRFHIIPDMDFSPAKDAQQVSTLFADGRVMRPDVPGTVTRGELDWDVDFKTGINMEKLTQLDPSRARHLVAMMQSDVEVGAEDEVVEEVKPDEPKTEEPKAEEPKTDEPKTEEPKTDEPKTEEPEAGESEGENAEADQPEADKPEMKEDEPAAAEEEKPATEEKPAAEEKPATDEKPATEEKSSTDEKPATEEKPADSETADQPQPEMKAETPVAEPEEAQTPAEQPTEKPEAPTALAPASGPTVDTTPWLTENPIDLTDATLERGQSQFNIYCAVCHGANGRGNGLVNQRAQQILATTWTPPSNMHDATLYADVYPDGKLFSTISNGIRKMPGYASQISAKDRWAVVAYVRALQASQNASIDDVPKAQRTKIEKAQAKVKAELEKAAAEAEAAATKPAM